MLMYDKKEIERIQNSTEPHFELHNGREIPDILEYSGMYIRVNKDKVEKLYK